MVRVICPNCGSNKVEGVRAPETIKDRDGQKYVIDGFEHSHCEHCDFDFVTSKQARRHDQLLADARRWAHGLLDSTQIRRIRERFDLRQEDASVLFGGGANAFSKYERGYVVQSIAMDRLLRVTDRFPGVIEYLEELAGLPIAARGTKRKVARLETRAVSKSSTVHEDIAAFEKVTGAGPKIVRLKRKSTTVSLGGESWVDVSVPING